APCPRPPRRRGSASPGIVLDRLATAVSGSPRPSPGAPARRRPRVAPVLRGAPDVYVSRRGAVERAERRSRGGEGRARALHFLTGGTVAVAAVVTVLGGIAGALAERDAALVI